MASVFVSSPAEIVVIDSRTRSGTITLPVTNSIPYRVVSFKDQYGSFSNSTLTLSTQIGESFDDGTTTKTFHTSYGFATLYATSSKWMVMNATQTLQQTISSLLVSSLRVTGDVTTVTLSSQQLFLSSINGEIPFLTTNIISTVKGLGTAGYVSTLSLVSTTSSLIYNYGAGLSTLSTAIFNSPFVYPGQLLYLNYGISTLTSDYRALQAAPRPLNAGYVVNTPLAGNSISSVAAFQSDFFLPSFIPAGFWENRLFAYASGTGVTAFTELYDRSPLGVETLIKTTSTATTSILTGTSPQENIINMNVPYTGISTGHTIVWKIFGSNSTAVPRNMFSYFENGNTYSYLITTFGGTAGYDFPAAFSTLALFTSNTSNYFSSQIVSTNLQLISTVGGLGSAGYLSSLSNIPYLSSQQIYASSIVFQTLVGPTTVVLYEY